MRPKLTKSDRQEIVNLVKSEFSKMTSDLGFEVCKAKNLWSREFSHGTGYLRFKRTLNFAEWPNFQLNFGLTPRLPSDVVKILDNLLRKNTPLHEMWAYNVKSGMLHYHEKSNALYSACYPGTWEFRNLKEVASKSKKIELYIQDHFEAYLTTYSSDHEITNYPFGVMTKGMKADFRVLQLVALGKTGDISKMKALIDYFEDSNKLVAQYGAELIKLYA